MVFQNNRPCSLFLKMVDSFQVRIIQMSFRPYTADSSSRRCGDSVNGLILFNQKKTVSFCSFYLDAKRTKTSRPFIGNCLWHRSPIHEKWKLLVKLTVSILNGFSKQSSLLTISENGRFYPGENNRDVI